MTYRDFQPAFCLQDLHICSAPTCTGTETHLDIPLGWPQFCFTNLIQRRMLYGEVKNSAWERCVQPPVQPEKNRSDRTTAAEPGQSSERQSCPPPSDRTREGEENPEAPKKRGSSRVFSRLEKAKARVQRTSREAKAQRKPDMRIRNPEGYTRC